MLKTSVTALALALALSACSPAAPQETRIASTATLQEDSPLWDCKTMGNKTCALTREVEAQAWESYDALGFAYETPMRVELVAHSNEPFEETPRGYVTVQKLTQPTAYYLFKLTPM